MKRAKKEIMAMVIEGMKGEGEIAKSKGSKADRAGIEHPPRARKRREEKRISKHVER